MPHSITFLGKIYQNTKNEEASEFFYLATLPELDAMTQGRDIDEAKYMIVDWVRSFLPKEERKNVYARIINFDIIGDLNILVECDDTEALQELIKKRKPVPCICEENKSGEPSTCATCGGELYFR